MHWSYHSLTQYAMSSLNVCNLVMKIWWITISCNECVIFFGLRNKNVRSFNVSCTYSAVRSVGLTPCSLIKMAVILQKTFSKEYLTWKCFELNFIDICSCVSNGGKSTSVQVMSWCHQAPRHYLKQCCQRSKMSHGFTRLQWVNIHQI